MGSLEVGKDGDVVVLSGPWYEPSSRVDWVIGNGAVVYDRAAVEAEEEASR